jgi:Fe-S-cluster containining protein
MTKKMAKKSGCQCEECQSLCQHEPGWFMPDEIELVARHLEMKSEDFLSTYAQLHETGGIIACSPRFLVREKRCIFFEGGRCRIHEVKPYECRKVYGCEEKHRHKRIRELILRQWAKSY